MLKDLRDESSREVYGLLPNIIHSSHDVKDSIKPLSATLSCLLIAISKADLVR